MENSYKAKYLQLRSQYMNAVDTAFRLGFEQGKQQADLDNVAQQQMQAQELASAAVSSPPGGAPGAGGGEMPQPGETSGAPGAEVGNETPAVPGEQMQESEHPDGTELDQHIAKLEAMLGKSEDINFEELSKAINSIKSFRKSQVQAIELKKSAQAIAEISKAMHRPSFKMSVQAAHNMNDNAKKSVTLQHRIVDDIMQKWEEEEHKTAKGILNVISVEGLTKKE